MQQLKAENLQKCVDLLEDFQSAVPMDALNNDLREKKQQAQHALEHLSQLLNGRADYVGSACSGDEDGEGKCKQDASA